MASVRMTSAPSSDGVARDAPSSCDYAERDPSNGGLLSERCRPDAGDMSELGEHGGFIRCVLPPPLLVLVLDLVWLRMWRSWVASGEAHDNSVRSRDQRR